MCTIWEMAELIRAEEAALAGMAATASAARQPAATPAIACQLPQAALPQRTEARTLPPRQRRRA